VPPQCPRPLPHVPRLNRGPPAPLPWSQHAPDPPLSRRTSGPYQLYRIVKHIVIRREKETTKGAGRLKAGSPSPGSGAAIARTPQHLRRAPRRPPPSPKTPLVPLPKNGFFTRLNHYFSRTPSPPRGDSPSVTCTPVFKGRKATRFWLFSSFNTCGKQGWDRPGRRPHIRQAAPTAHISRASLHSTGFN
jgi:hypothetical protein